MKIGLIFPNKDRRYKTIHLGLGYIASYAKSQHNDLEIQILDTRVATSRETRAFFNTTFDLVGITVFSPVYKEVIQIFNKLKTNCKNTSVCLGGPYTTTLMQEIFEDTPAEYAVFGEGEITFSELVFYIKGQKEINEIQGLMYRTEQGKYVVNEPREQIKDLDSIPIPAYELFKMDRYPLHRLVTSRGCPYSCSFCNSSSIWGGKWRKRSAPKVYEEITFLVNTYGRKNFGFNDNSFNIDKKYVEEICDLLIKNKTGILWSTPVRAEKITEELAFKMKEAGCYNVSIGIESANNEILKEIGKKTTINDISKGIVALKNAGIEVLGQFVIGSPYETLNNVKESVAFAKSSRLDYVNFYTILPFKGTPQWTYVQNEANLYYNKIHQFHSVSPRIIFETKEFSYNERLEAIKLVTKEGFYSNQDKRSRMFDFAKEFSRILQKYLPAGISRKIYMLLKSIYKIRVVKKNNL